MTIIEKQDLPFSSVLPLSDKIERLIDLYRATRDESLQITQSMSPEDAQLQSMPDASPAKWHLAHTTWFFETFILKAFNASYVEFNPHFRVLFNSYYNAIGDQYTRSKRGLLSRPSLEEVYSYRRYVDKHLRCYLQSLGLSSEVSTELNLLDKKNKTSKLQLTWLLTLGIQHEKQHQELMLMDIKHAFYQNPMRPPLMLPANDNVDGLEVQKTPDLTWTNFSDGLRSVGVDASFSSVKNTSSQVLSRDKCSFETFSFDAFSFDIFSFDNENPKHKRYIDSFRIANRPVTNGEYLAFVEDSGYQRSEFWLADGWSLICENKLTAPLYWQCVEGQWMVFTLHGLCKLDTNRPVCHLSYFEADAYANWSGKRLPTEFEWEIAANEASKIGVKKDYAAPQFNNFVDLEPRPVSENPLSDMLGGVWEWTSSNYAAYPRFKPFAGGAGEYNGKFMSGQFVLRGGACISPERHIRNTYRNFFYPHQRWAFSGLRLADDSLGA